MNRLGKHWFQFQVLLHQEESGGWRGVRWLDPLAQDLRFGARQLLKNPGFTATAVITLALGIGANTAIFSVINAVLMRPLRYPESDRLMTLWERNSGQGIEAERVSGPDFLDWRAQSRSFVELGFWNGANDFNLVGSNGVVKIECAYAYSTLFPVLGVKPLLGRTFLPEEDRREGSQSAVITYDLWRRVFDRDPNILGRTLTVDTYGRRDYTIVGVMPAGFELPSRCDACLAYGWMGVRLDERRSAHWYQVFGRLGPGATVEQARVEMSVIQARIERENPGNIIGSEVAVVPLLEQTVGRKTRLALLVLGGVVAHAVGRRTRELGIRLALGAQRRALTRLVISQGMRPALVGLVLGVGAALGLTRYFAAQLFEIKPADPATFAAVAIVLLLVAFLACWVPARRAARVDPMRALRAE